MQKNHAVEYHSLQKYFAAFCNDTKLLPAKTPIFIIDSRMRIVLKRGQMPKGICFENLGGLLSRKEFEFFASVRKSEDASAVFLEDGKNKEFAVISGIQDGFSRCVVCSYCEDNCTGLSDYYEKLCSYKGYLDMFSGVSCSGYPRMPVTSMLRMRASGVYHLMNMALLEPSSAHLKESAVPFITALEKLAVFVGKTYENFGDICKISVDGDNVPVMLSVRLMNIIVSCMGFVARDSDDGNLFLDVSERNARLAVLSVSSKKKHIGRGGIYKDHILQMLDGMGISYRYSEKEGVCTFELELKRADVSETVMSEPEQIQEITDSCVSQKWLEDVICTIMNI